MFTPKKIRNCSPLPPFLMRILSCKDFSASSEQGFMQGRSQHLQPSSSIRRLTQQPAAHPALPRLGKTSRVKAMQKSQQDVLHSHLRNAGYSSRGRQRSAREATRISAHRGVNLSLATGCSDCLGRQPAGYGRAVLLSAPGYEDSFQRLAIKPGKHSAGA